MKKYLFITLIIALLIIGNIWCYIENQRLLNPMTNLVMILVLFGGYKNTKS